MSRRVLMQVVAGVVALATAVTSGYALIMLALWSGLPEPLAPALPLAVDGAGVVGALCWITRKDSARTWGKSTAIAALLLSMAANALHASGASDRWFAPVVGALIPASLWVTVHLLAIPERVPATRKPASRRKSATTPARRPEPVTSMPQSVKQPSAPHPVTDGATEKIRAALIDLGYPHRDIARGTLARLDADNGVTGLARQVAKRLREAA